MDRINSLLCNEVYRDYLHRNFLAEQERKFCKHDMEHFLAVARIGMILNEKEAYGVSKELLYTTALLHDIGRWQQYQDGTPHEKASADLAPALLDDCGYNKEEKEAVVAAILSHRDASVKEEKSLRGLLYRADKLSRSCFACEAEKECDWKADKKNLRLYL